MHEIAPTQNLVNIALSQAQAQQAARVTNVYIKRGQLSDITAESIRFYWDVLSEGTICQGAQLHFEEVPALIICDNCQHTMPLEDELGPCPKCGSTHIQLSGGQDLQLAGIDIEQAEIHA